MAPDLVAVIESNLLVEMIFVNCIEQNSSTLVEEKMRSKQLSSLTCCAGVCDGCDTGTGGALPGCACELGGIFDRFGG